MRGVGSQMPWKHGFLKDSTSYKKSDRYKKSLEEKIEYKVSMLFENRFMEFIQNLSQQPGSSPLHLLAPQATNLSSMGSMIGLATCYPVDDITVDTPCRLHIPLGRVGNKIKEVATGVAMPGRVFHNNPTPAEYAKVLVREITDMGYTNYSLDHVTSEGVKELGLAVNQFIVWNQREIFLNGPISPQRQHIQLSQTPTSSLVEHALATLAQQTTQRLSSPHTEQEASQQPPQLPLKDKEALQLSPPHTMQEALQQPPQLPSKDKEAQQLPSPHTEQEAPQQPPQSPPNDKEAPQLLSPPTETIAIKDKKASLV
jgi:hypothetical protein